MMLALGVGYVTSGGSLLFYEYKYATTLDSRHESPINSYGVGESATYALADAARLDSLRSAKPEAFSTTGNLLSGAAITGALAALSLRFAWWPIHPLGYLLLFSWTTWAIWPSRRSSFPEMEPSWNATSASGADARLRGAAMGGPVEVVHGDPRGVSRSVLRATRR